jgi:dephospho-CoA kinase
MFRALGCEVIDADQLAREVVEPGEPALAEIVAEFGPGVLQPDGRLDRKALGALVFADPARLAALAAAGFRGVVIFDAALLVETGAAAMMDRLVVVVADEATQLARLMARDGLSPEQARQRLRSQLPVADKVRHAHYVIDNSGDRTATAARVREVYQALLADWERGAGAP